MIFLFSKIRNNDASDFNFAKFREIPRNFVVLYFAKFREIVSLCKFFKYQYISRNIAKLFRYVNFSNPIHKESILIKKF
jgi:hypothetical protein